MTAKPASRDRMIYLAERWEAEAENSNWNGLIRNTYSECATALRAALEP